MMNKILAVVLTLSFLLRLAIAIQPTETLIQKIMIDDTFYGFETAKNMATGFVSHNGVEPTNGVQPLWPLMVSQFFNFEVGVRLALLTAVMLDALVVFLVYKIARKFSSEKVSLAGAALYGINPLVAFTSISGIDVVLAVFMVALSFYLFAYRKNETLLGISLGLGMLARADIILLFLPISAFLFLQNKKSWLKVSAIAILIFSSWLAWSFMNFGTIQQSSGLANFAHAHGIYKIPQPTYSAVEWLEVGMGNFAKLTSFVFSYFGAVDYSAFSFFIAGIFAFLILAGVFFHGKVFKIPAAYALLLISFYSFYLWSFGPRYVAPLLIFAAPLAALGLNMVLRAANIEKIFFPAALVLIIMLSYSGLQQWEKGYYPWQVAVLDEVNWIKGNTSESDVIGSFNSGIITFYSGRNVVNLDGIMNFKAIEAAKERKIYDYMKSKNFDYWTDIDFLPAEVYSQQESFNISKENRWVGVLGNGSENLKLIEQKFYQFKNLRGNNITIVFFMFKVNS